VREEDRAPLPLLHRLPALGALKEEQQLHMLLLLERYREAATWFAICRYNRQGRARGWNMSV
jgi:hypothetical protein